MSHSTTSGAGGPHQLEAGAAVTGLADQLEVVLGLDERA
jgi:hypothetical protein